LFFVPQVAALALLHRPEVSAFKRSSLSSPGSSVAAEQYGRVRQYLVFDNLLSFGDASDQLPSGAWIFVYPVHYEASGYPADLHLVMWGFDVIVDMMLDQTDPRRLHFCV